MDLGLRTSLASTAAAHPIAAFEPARPGHETLERAVSEVAQEEHRDARADGQWREERFEQERREDALRAIVIKG